MIPRILHQVQLGGPPSLQVVKWMLGVKIANPDFQYKLWTESNVGQLDIEPWQWEHASLAGSSNIIRLYALLRHGGIYVDTDCQSVKSLAPLVDRRAFVARQPDGVLCNAVFGAEKDHDWILFMLEKYGDQRKKDAAWGCHVMQDTKLIGVDELPGNFFYPYGHDTPPEQRQVHPDSFLIHHWLGSWIEKP